MAPSTLIQMASNANAPYPTVASNDMLVLTGSNDQSLFLGAGGLNYVKVASNVVYTPSNLTVAGSVTATTFVGALTGNASGLTGSPTVTVSTLTSTTHSNTGVFSNAGASFFGGAINALGQTVTATTFVGELTGNASTATSASTATFATAATNSSNASNAIYATSAGSATTATSASGLSGNPTITVSTLNSTTLSNTGTFKNDGSFIQGAPIRITSSLNTNHNRIHFSNLTNGVTYTMQQVDHAGQDYFRIGRNGYGDIVVANTASNGYVGINTAAPTYQLDVNGAVRTNSNITVDGIVFAGTMCNTGTFCNVGNAFFGSDLTVRGTTIVQNITVSNVETLVQSFSNQGTMSNIGAAVFGSTVSTQGLSNVGYLSNMGGFCNMGPASFGGAITATGQTMTAGTFSASSMILVGPSPHNHPISVDVSSNNANSCISVITSSNNNPGLALINKSGTVNYIFNAGGVGSGAVGTNPGDMVITSACNLVLGVDAGNLYLQKTTGYVGIGQNTPTYALDVNGTGSTPLLNLVNSTTNVASNIGSTLNLQTIKYNPGLGGDARLTTYAKRNNYPSTDTWYGVSARMEYSINDGSKKAYIEFNPSNNVLNEDSGMAFGFANAEAMRINRIGNVGIGTTNPQSTLDVNGTVNVAGRTNFNMGGEYLYISTNTGNIQPASGFGGAIGYNYSGGGSAMDFINCDPSSNYIYTAFDFWAMTNGTMSNVLKIMRRGNVTISGSLSKASGTFDIQHPLSSNSNDRLINSFIEGPRCDLIYRGTTTLMNGQSIVNLDTDCVSKPECAMQDGTFVALCANPVKYLHNNTSFDPVRGSIQGNILTITCANTTSSDTIDWMVIAERKDTFIKQWDKTNSDGYLITEYTKTD